VRHLFQQRQPCPPTVREMDVDSSRPLAHYSISSSTMRRMASRIFGSSTSRDRLP
jgi:hypothetical protein